jgi:hypothetical protein
MQDCFGKQVFGTLAKRIQQSPEGATVWLAPHEAKFCNESGAVQVQQHKVTGEKRVVFTGCTYPACNCDQIKQWYAKDYQDE